MSSLIPQLNNEALLLMYLAGELPAEDRAELEQMLAGDSSLRAQLQQLRSAQSMVFDSLQEMDRARAGPDAHVLRQVNTAMSQWRVDQLVYANASPPRKSLRYPWWAYPLASAAAVVLAFLVWWGNHSDNSLPIGAGSSMVAQSVGAGKSDGSLRDTSEKVADGEDAVAQLDDAQSQATALASSSSDETSNIFMMDVNH